MADYLHGAYSQIQTVGSRVSDNSQNAVLYVGTAPVHTVEGGGANVNVPIVVRNIAEARKYFGYSEDWAKYTLCEAMHVHLELNGVGPIILINVLDPATHISSTAGSVSKTPENGKIVLDSAEDIILDTVEIKTTGASPVTKVKGTDYDIAYEVDKKRIVITEIGSGLGTAALAITYSNIDATAVTTANVIGATDGSGSNTGLYAIKNVYSLTGYVPSFLCAPGFSSIKAVHDVMAQVSKKINGHWDTYMFVDLPLMNNSTALTLDTIKTYKDANGYNNPNETVYWPMATGTDDKQYHLSVLAAANFQALLLEQDGIPYRTASNTDCALIADLYTADNSVARVYDDSLINAKLNKNGIASAAFVGGRWAIWGAHSADYDQTNADTLNVSETNRMMLYYISNDFQARRFTDVDRPMTRNDLETIVAEEQMRLDSLLSIGALTYGEVSVNATPDTRSDLMQGDFSFTFNVTTTPLAKSLTAIVNWTDEGFVTYFASLTE